MIEGGEICKLDVIFQVYAALKLQQLSTTQYNSALHDEVQMFQDIKSKYLRYFRLSVPDVLRRLFESRAEAVLFSSGIWCPER